MTPVPQDPSAPAGPASYALRVSRVDARWRVEATTLASVSSNTPLLGMELPGVVRLTVANGRVTYRG